MSLLTYQLRSLTAVEEDDIAAEDIGKLRDVIARLQLLVCELLEQNQQLRFQRGDE